MRGEAVRFKAPILEKEMAVLSKGDGRSFERLHTSEHTKEHCLGNESFSRMEGRKKQR